MTKKDVPLRARLHPGCVACSPSHPHGLRLSWTRQPDGSVEAVVDPRVVVLYSLDVDCEVASEATALLRDVGVDARQLEGGLAAWARLGLPVDQ